MSHTALELVEALRWVGLGLVIAVPLAMAWLGRRRPKGHGVAEYSVEADVGDELRFVAADERIACDEPAREVA
ncbi:MAG: hypothetical protein IV100_12505 [Myxococcales bacterium]|uniref:hypothetical protein n=1 Tax=Sediminibacterium sp. TaxID=1917865 RepID=UPI001DDEC02D|nr:hypothetical protein [Sediminibacterium sp.]MBT9556847.1 hypothetical protein [Myxococcales bacterium]